MSRIRFFKTLKSRLIICFLALAIVPSVVISYYYFKNSQRTLEDNMIGTSVSNLAYTVTIIDKQLEHAAQLSDWLFMNKNLDRVLTKDYSELESGYDADIDTFLELKDYQLRFNSAVGTYVYSVFIRGHNGLDLRAGQPQGTQVDLAQLEKTDWFKYGMSLQGKKGWYGIVENPSKDSYAKHILPLVRPVFHSVTNREIGWHIIGFRVNLISDLFKGLQSRSDEMLIVVDPNNRAVYHSDPALIGRDLIGLDYIDHAVYQSAYQGSTNARISGEQRHVTFARSESTGWGIVQVLSSTELNEQRGFLLRVTVIILLSSFVFVALLTIYLSSNLTQPLTNILNRTKAIASGSFDRDPSIEGDGELGTLGRAVNQMADNIRNLLNQVIDDEREKRRLELQVLQHQVNPHFLYNTLNSLKVMATIQKADGIKRMVTALGRLLMYLSRNASEAITLEEEISLLNDYIYVQNMRYRGRIQLEYHLDNPEWLNCRIIRFTLQPIIENSIFHGIEPKRDAGKIDLTVSERGGRLVICVRDDGVGMTDDEIEAALNAPPDKKARGLSGIGIRNVNERIKLVYGQEYGLTIKSSVSEYTEVCIEIPLQVDRASDLTAATAGAEELEIEEWGDSRAEDEDSDYR